MYREPATGKFSILGAFDRIFGRKFPAQHGPFGAYFAVTELKGKYDFSLRIVLAEDDQTKIFEYGMHVECDDPFQVVEFGGNFPPIEFPEPGDYRLQLYAGDEPLGERRILVLPAPESPDVSQASSENQE